jgi:hypothetical protein
VYVSGVDRDRERRTINRRETMHDDEHDPYEGQTRDEYLADLAEDYGLPVYVVQTLADMLGSDEDFDGLISAMEDADPDDFN